MFQKIKKVSIEDILGIFKFLFALVPSLVYKIYLKIRRNTLLLVSEKENMARDNGYIFYKFMKEKHPEIKCYYAIDTNCSDYNKVKVLGNVVKWASVKHYFLYMSSTFNLSSHKEGNPNQALFTVLHLFMHLYNNRVFLQHGITKDNLPMFYYKNTKFKYFVCGAKKEYDYILEKFGYPEKNVIYTGFARFDNLYNCNVDNQKILFIPTWRRWLDSEQAVLNSEYYANLCKIVNSKTLEQLLEKYDKYLYFYPHASMQQYLSDFKIINSRVKMCDIKNSNIQELLKNGSLLITDYSSVYFDFAYMNKPIIYFQKDYKDYREKHMPEGYFDYERDGFGKVCYTVDELENKLEEYLKNNYEIEKVYLDRMNTFFTLKDDKNCERIFQKIMKKGD